MSKTVIILGGGSGGLVCANKLRKILSREHRIILVDKEEKHLFYASLLWLIFDWRKPEQIENSLSKLNKKGIEFIHGEIDEIDLKNHSVQVRREKLNYDYLVVSLGAELNKSKMPQTDRIFDFYSLEGAERLRKNLKNFTEGKIVILVSSKPFKCPAAPYEVAFLLDYYFKKKNLRDKIKIEIFTCETLPMETAGPELGNAVKQMAEQRNIRFNPNLKLSLIEGEKREIIFEQNRRESFDLLLIVPPHQVPQVVKSAGLTEETGWIQVDSKTLKTKYNNVYAIGDINAIKLPGQYKPQSPLNLPKAGVFAHYQALVVANNLALEITGVGKEKVFEGKGSCFLELGEGKAGFASGDFFALPAPEVKMQTPSRIWHLGKILFEKWWLWKWF